MLVCSTARKEAADGLAHGRTARACALAGVGQHVVMMWAVCCNVSIIVSQVKAHMGWLCWCTCLWHRRAACGVW